MTGHNGIELPTCSVCGKRCQPSKTTGFFSCVKMGCSKYMLLQFDDMELWDRIINKVKENGTVHLSHKRSKKVMQKRMDMR